MQATDCPRRWGDHGHYNRSVCPPLRLKLLFPLAGQINPQDVMSWDLPPVVYIRGNNENVLTFEL